MTVPDVLFPDAAVFVHALRVRPAGAAAVVSCGSWGPAALQFAADVLAPPAAEASALLDDHQRREAEAAPRRHVDELDLSELVRVAAWSLPARPQQEPDLANLAPLARALRRGAAGRAVVARARHPGWDTNVPLTGGEPGLGYAGAHIARRTGYYGEVVPACGLFETASAAVALAVELVMMTLVPGGDGSSSRAEEGQGGPPTPVEIEAPLRVAAAVLALLRDELAMAIEFKASGGTQQR